VRAEAFRAFFTGTPELPGVMQDAGAQSAPEITIVDTIDSPDQCSDRPPPSAWRDWSRTGVDQTVEQV